MNPSTAARFRGQFVITRDPGRVPAGVDLIREREGWLLGTCKVPAVDIVAPDGRLLGWCLGYPVPFPGRSIVWTGHEQFYDSNSGRFAVFLFNEGLYLDACGSLGVVYRTDEATVASTPSFIEAEYDAAFAAEIGFPDRSGWLPSGLTLFHGVRRLQADHRLDLHTWTPIRHWLPPAVGTSESVREFVAAVRATVGALARRHRLVLPLTAGRDSRILLACARPYLDAVEFFTMAPDAASVDAHIATRIASACGLRHRLLPIIHATPEQRRVWLESTGSAVSGAILDVHPTLDQLEPTMPILPAIGGEVGRAFYWDASGVTVPQLLDRMNLPHHPRLVAATTAWLTPEVAGLDRRTLLDLAYIEQRLSCWAAPQHYGNHTSLYEVMALVSRASFRAMLCLPYEFRARDGLFRAVCEEEWPDLLRWPVNRYSWWEGLASRLRHDGLRATKWAIKRLVGRK